METSTMEKICTRSLSKGFFVENTSKEANLDTQNGRKLRPRKPKAVFQTKVGTKTRIRGQKRKRKFNDDSPDPKKKLNSSLDGVLRTEDRKKFDVNRNLLAQLCPYFRALFFGGLADGKNVLLKGIDAKTLESILAYLYTGTVQLNEENTADMLFASDYLQIEPLFQECKAFAIKQITPINCVPLFVAAWRIERLGILNDCYRFMVIHFEEVMRQSKEIGSLPLEGLKKILGERSLNVSRERTVWNAIVKWIEFDWPKRLQLVTELLNFISFEDADLKLFHDIIFHNLIQKSNFCLQPLFRELQSITKQPEHRYPTRYSQRYQIQFKKLIQRRTLVSSKTLRTFRQIMESRNITSAKRIPANVNFIIYNCKAHGSPEKNMYLTWDGEIDYWRKVGSVHFFPDYVIHLDHYVFMLNATFNLSLAFDIYAKKCLPVTPIFQSRCYFSVVSVKGFLYIMGGINNRWNRMEEIERFDPKTGIWDLVHPMAPMTLSKAIALDGYIYAIGYNGEGTNLKIMVQVYDPASNIWSFVTPPNQFMYVKFAIVYRKHIFVIGGCSYIGGARMANEYDPIKDVWIPMPDSPFSYHTPRAVALNDFLIFYEANPVNASSVHPVYWVPENRTWDIIQESSPLRYIRFFRFCTVAEANVVSDIVKQNKQQIKSWIKSPLAQLISVDFQ